MIADPWGDGEVVKRRYPVCCVCRKESDGSQRPWVNALDVNGGPLWLCGTHHDEWLKSREYRMVEMPIHRRFAAWATPLRTGKYRACWVTE